MNVHGACDQGPRMCTSLRGLSPPKLYSGSHLRPTTALNLLSASRRRDSAARRQRKQFPCGSASEAQSLVASSSRVFRGLPCSSRSLSFQRSTFNPRAHLQVQCLRSIASVTKTHAPKSGSPSQLPPSLGPSLAAAAAATAAATAAIAIGFAFPWADTNPADAQGLWHMLAVAGCAYLLGAATAAAIPTAVRTPRQEKATGELTPAASLLGRDYRHNAPDLDQGSDGGEHPEAGGQSTNARSAGPVLKSEPDAIADGNLSAWLPVSQSLLESSTGLPEPLSPRETSPTECTLHSLADSYQSLLQQDSSWRPQGPSAQGMATTVLTKGSLQHEQGAPGGLAAMQWGEVEDEEWRMAGEVWGRQPQLLLQGLRVRERQRLLWAACTAFLDEVAAIPVSTNEMEPSVWAKVCKDVLVRSSRECALSWLHRRPASTSMPRSSSFPDGAESEVPFPVLLLEVWEDGRGVLYQDLVRALRFQHERGSDGDTSQGTSRLQLLRVLSPQPGAPPNNSLVNPPLAIPAAPRGSTESNQSIQVASGEPLSSPDTGKGRLLGFRSRVEAQVGLVMDDAVVLVAESALEGLLEGWAGGEAGAHVEKSFCNALQSTRALARFRNEVSLSKWLHWNFSAVSDLLADRCPLWSIRSPRPAAGKPPMTQVQSATPQAEDPDSSALIKVGTAPAPATGEDHSEGFFSHATASSTLARPFQEQSQGGAWDPLSISQHESARSRSMVDTSWEFAGGKRPIYWQRHTTQSTSTGLEDGETNHRGTTRDEPDPGANATPVWRQSGSQGPAGAEWPAAVGAVLAACMGMLGLSEWGSPTSSGQGQDLPRSEVPQGREGAQDQGTSLDVERSTLLRVAVQYVSLRRTREELLTALTGWRLVLCLWLELTDLFGPFVRRVVRGITQWVSFVLVTLIGRTLGLIFKGMKSSLKFS